jgi:putative spermidine/putrescine transport system substrate-binding protein
MFIRMEKNRAIAIASLSLGIAALAIAGTARAEDKLIIASYGGTTGELWKQTVAEPFQKQTGIPTEIFESPLPASSVASAGGSPQFHLAVIAGYQVPALVKAGKVETLDPARIPNLKNIPEKYWLKTPDGKLEGIPVYQSFYGIAYNKDMAKASDFNSWESLANPKWKGLISVSRAPFVAAYDLTLFTKLAGGDGSNIDPGVPLLKKILPNVTAAYSSMASLLSQLGRGEVVAAPFYSTQITQLKKSGVTNVDITIPKEGGLLLPYFLVIPKGAANVEASYRLLNEILTPAYQQQLATGAVWPVNPSAKLPPALEKEMGATLDEALARNFAADWWAVGSAQAERTRRVEDLLSEIR